jgi:hypothetical protein
MEQGVVCNASSASTLSIDNGTCTGVQTELLLDTAPNLEELHVGERMIAAGTIQCSASHPPDQMYKLRSVPVMFNGCDHTER